MRVVIADCSVFIDLERGGLLDHVFHLPFAFTVPDILFERELKANSGADLQRKGLYTEELTSNEMRRATILLRQNAVISTPEAFAFSLAESRRWPILTDNDRLAKFASEHQLETRGILWIIDQMEVGHRLSPSELHASLSAIACYPRCQLPPSEIDRRLAAWVS